MTKPEAIQWVDEHDDEMTIDNEELEAAFVALYDRQPDEEDREIGLWSLLCAGIPWVVR